MKYEQFKPGKRVFEQFINSTWDDFSLDTPHKEYLREQVRDYISDLDKHVKNNVGLTIVGEPGLGKTMLCHFVLRAAYDAGYSYRAIEVEHFVTLHQELFGLSNRLQTLGLNAPPEQWIKQEEMMDFLESLRQECQVLLLDDMGKEYQSKSGWSNHLLNHLIRYRYNNGVGPTLITSNVPISEWGETYDRAVESFLHESTLVLNVRGDDFRRS